MVSLLIPWQTAAAAAAAEYGVTAGQQGAGAQGGRGVGAAANHNLGKVNHHAKTPKMKKAKR